jgi:penicillin-binding protein 1A
LAPTAIRYVTDAEGRLLEEHVPEGKEAVSPELAYVITHMLKGVVDRGTGQGARALNRPIAAKTGTTNDYSNAWFIGFTPRLATGVWVGYDRPRSLGRDETGSRVAVPIWTSYMQKVVGKDPKEDFPVPERVAMAPVDLDPSNECVRVVTMAFVRGTEPELPCGVRREAITPPASALPPLVPESAPVAPGVAPSAGSLPGSSDAPGPAPLPPPPAAGWSGPSVPASPPSVRGSESELPQPGGTVREPR